MKNKNLNLPSTFVLKNYTSKYYFDINALFWNSLFSEKYLTKIFQEIKLRNKITDFEEIYFDYLIVNISAIKSMMSDCYVYKYLEKNVYLCFKVFYLIVNIFNLISSDHRISLSYGISYLKDISNISLSINNIFINQFFDDILNNSFFEDNIQYNINIHWENELYSLILLSIKLREKFKNVRVIVDFSQVNEQVDFTQWISNNNIRQYIDNFNNIYHEDNHKIINANYHIGDVFKTKNIGTRLFNTKCYWNKCSFCTINSRHKSDHTFNSLTKEAKEIVDSFIKSILNYNELIYITFSDEAIESSILLYFAEQIINQNINIKWIARTRFSNIFTYENCKTLSQSGLKMIGLGLESVNPRILSLMNKREKFYDTQELNRIIGNFDQNNVSVHTYFIIGFPSETKKETKQTLNFIDYNLKKRKYFTYSANRFYLMKGSKIYSNPKEFGIEIIDKGEDVKIGNINYIDQNKGHKYSREEILFLSKKAYSKMFFKKVNNNYLIILGCNFWDFIDRTALFYIHKYYNELNPYFRRNKKRIKLHDEDLDSFYKIISIPIYKLNPLIYFDIINDRYIRIKEILKNLFYKFINSYNTKLTLRQNIYEILQKLDYKCSNKQINLFNKMIIQLIDDAYLYRIEKL